MTLHALDAAGPVPLTPPRIDHWPPAVRTAELLTGSLVRCGPGVRPVGWPDSPRMRLAALAPSLGADHIATHETAAWVWQALDQPGRPLRVAQRRGAPRSFSRRSDVHAHEMRLRDDELTAYDGHAVTTPLRTAFDLIHNATEWNARTIAACRLLIGDDAHAAAAIHTMIRHRTYPGHARARVRAQKIWPEDPPAMPH